MAVRQPIKNAASARAASPRPRRMSATGSKRSCRTTRSCGGWSVQAKDRGSVTFDQLNAALPQDFPPEQTEEVIQLLDAQGIMVLRDDAGGDIEAEPAEAEPAAEGEPAAGGSRGRGGRRSGPEEELGRTDDPVRMYLREMGTIELLSREGEIEIAKRIEAGRNTRAGGAVREPADDARGDRLARRDPRGPRAAARHHRPRGHQRHRPERRGGWPRPGDRRGRPSRWRNRVARGGRDRRRGGGRSPQRGGQAADGDADDDEDARDRRGRRGEDEGGAPMPEVPRGGRFRRGHAVAVGAREQAARRRAGDLRRGSPRPIAACASCRSSGSR